MFRHRYKKSFYLPFSRKESRIEAELGLDEIKRMAETVQKDSGRDKDELRTWMAKKRHAQMNQYKQHVDELRERETRPFRPAHENQDQVRLTT